MTVPFQLEWVAFKIANCRYSIKTMFEILQNELFFYSSIEI